MNGDIKKRSYGKVLNSTVSVKHYFACFTLGQKIDIRKLSTAADGGRFIHIFFLCLPYPRSCYFQIFEPLTKTLDTNELITKYFGKLLYLRACNFDSPHAKENLISSIINFICELLDNLRLRILGNRKEISKLRGGTG